MTAYSQTDTLHINGNTFITRITVTPLTEYGRHDTVLNFSRLENGRPKYLLQHTLYSYSADCNNEFITRGTYEVRHDSLIFNNTIKQKTGLDPVADEEQQIYRVAADGKLKLVSNKEHIGHAWKEISTR